MLDNTKPTEWGCDLTVLSKAEEIIIIKQKSQEALPCWAFKVLNSLNLISAKLKKYIKNILYCLDLMHLPGLPL